MLRTSLQGYISLFLQQVPKSQTRESADILILHGAKMQVSYMKRHKSSLINLTQQKESKYNNIPYCHKKEIVITWGDIQSGPSVRISLELP